jgi:hypothetical protein
MKKKTFLSAILLFCMNIFQAQKQKNTFFDATAFQMGYAYLSKNCAILGFEKRIDNQNDWIYINLGAGLLLSNVGNNFQMAPEIHVNYTLFILMADASVTSKSLNPSLGLNIFNKVILKSGYNFAYRKGNFEGITFGININLGSDDYHNMAPMKFW